MKYGTTEKGFNAGMLICLLIGALSIFLLTNWIVRSYFISDPTVPEQTIQATPEETFFLGRILLKNGPRVGIEEPKMRLLLAMSYRDQKMILETEELSR